MPFQKYRNEPSMYLKTIPWNCEYRVKRNAIKSYKVGRKLLLPSPYFKAWPITSKIIPTYSNWLLSNFQSLQGKILQSFLIWWENKKEQIPLKHYWWFSIVFQSLLKRKQYKKTAKLSQCGRGTLEIQTQSGRAVLLLQIGTKLIYSLFKRACWSTRA